jgi:hypothetical protein
LKLLLAGSLVVLAVSPATAQAGTDFSGTWMLETSSQPSVSSADTLIVRQSVVSTNPGAVAIKPFFKEISIERMVSGAAASEAYRIGVVGGLVSGVVGDPDAARYRRERVVWEGNTLIFDIESYNGPSRETGDWVERHEAWSLDQAGRLHIAIGSRSAAGASTVALVYRRQ